MKTRIIILIALSAVATLSFTFTSAKSADKKQVSSTQKVVDSPAEGLGLEDKF